MGAQQGKEANPDGNESEELDPYDEVYQKTPKKTTKPDPVDDEDEYVNTVSFAKKKNASPVANEEGFDEYMNMASQPKPNKKKKNGDSNPTEEPGAEEFYVNEEVRT